MYRTEKAAYYGEKYDGIFDDIPSEYAEMYEEMDIILHKYCSLQWNHRADLKAYALMFRNVDIDCCNIVDKAFFLNRSNEIIGYKDKVYSANASVKEKLLKYYYEYDRLFELFYKNKTGERLTTIEPQKHWKLTIEKYQIIEDGNFDHIFSIVDLSEQQCGILLRNIDELVDACSHHIYNLHIIPEYDSLEAFVKNIVLPYIWGDEIFHRDCFQVFAKNTCPNTQLSLLSDKQYKRGKVIYDIVKQRSDYYTDPEIESLRLKIEELLEPLHKLSLLRTNPLSITVKPTSAISKPSVKLWAIALNQGLPENQVLEIMKKEVDLNWKMKQRKEKEIKEAKAKTEEQQKREIEKLEHLIKHNKPQIDAIYKEIRQIQEEKHGIAINEYEKLVREVSDLIKQNESNSWWYMFEHQRALHDCIDTFYINRYLHYKQISLKDKTLSLMSLQRKQVDEYVKFMSNSQNKENFEKRIKISLERSAQENICFDIGRAKMWVNYVKPIIAEKEEIERKIREEEERKRQEEEEERLEQYRFNIRNRHWRDNKVSFREADHIYIVDGTPLDSVTTFVKNCFPEFDSEFHAKRKAETLGITKEAVLEMWEKKGRESREQGTAMHKKIESYYLGKEPSTDDTFDLFKIFANKITLKPYRTEWAVYDWERKIAGTIDFVDYQNGEYIIYDWKRSDKLIAKNGLPIKNSQYGEKALPPIENLDNSPYYHYALQLSLYKYILEKNYGITVSKLRLGIFHPSYNKPYVLEMPYLQNEINTLFGLRSEVIF